MLEQLLQSNLIYFQLARFSATLIIGVLATRALLMPLTVRILSRKAGSKKARHSIENITAIIGFFFVLIISLQVANFGNLLTVLGTLAAAATVAIGFGMRDQVASVIAGVFIHLDNPFVKGDYIKVNDTEGVIRNIKLRTTILNGKGNAEQVVPNNILTTNSVKNYTKESITKVSVETVVKSERAEKASDLLLSAIDGSDAALNKPEPKVNFRKIEEAKTEMEASFWIRNPENLKDARSSVLKDYSQKASEENLFEEEKDE